MSNLTQKHQPLVGEGVYGAPLGATVCPVCKAQEARFFLVKDGYTLFKCHHCDFLFAHPYPNDAVLAQHYVHNYRSATATFYPKAADRRWRGFWRSLPLARYVVNKDVLDVGCGGGFMVEAFARLGARASGLDISENSIAYARNRWPHYSFYCESLAAFRQRGLLYDFVFSSEVLEHVPGPDEFMQTLAAVTKLGGFVYVSAPDAGHPAVPSAIETWSDICPPEHLQWFNAGNLALLFKQYGFKVHRRYKSKTPSHSVIFKKITEIFIEGNKE